MNNIPGGYYEDWDAAELGPWGTNAQKTLTKMFSLWDLNIRKYLTAGSGVHDVIMQTYTGKPRVVAYLPNGPDPVSLALAEKYGRTFISYGPFLFSNPLPGTTIGVASLSDNVTIRVRLFSVNGLSKIEVYGKGGRIIQTIPLGTATFKDLEITIPVNQATNGTETGYIVLIAYDASNNRAINNSIWIDLNTLPVTTTITETVTETTTTTQTVTNTATTSVTVASTKTETTTYSTTLTTTQTLESVTTTTYTSTYTSEKIVTQTDYMVTGVVAIAFLAIGLGLSRILFRK
uniref:Uncharacterized protein n=1 Tax=Thermosphaera aggregans TaxID=54254 RepID=A0A7C2BKF3_9CREN